MKIPKLRTYGHDSTIHDTHLVDVETDKDGQVVAVWFRCQAIRFEQSLVEPGRAREMKAMYKRNGLPKLHAIVVEDKPRQI